MLGGGGQRGGRGEGQRGSGWTQMGQRLTCKGGREKGRAWEGTGCCRAPSSRESAGGGPKALSRQPLPPYSAPSGVQLDSLALMSAVLVALPTGEILG